MLEALGRLCQGPAGATVIDHLRQWAPAWLAQLAGVVPPAEHEQLQRHTRGVTRERLLRELAEALEALTATHLLVLVLEDLHWSDASTVDVLSLLARRREAARLLVIGTYRPTELVLREHPLKQAEAELRLHGHCGELALHALSRRRWTRMWRTVSRAPGARHWSCHVSTHSGASVVHGAPGGVSGAAGSARHERG